MSEEIICKIDNIVKQFPGTTALDHVSFNVKRGEVHAIVGENGAGKSTLMNILSGVFPPTEGTVTFNGKECHFASPSEAEQAGIAMIHQELSLSPTMTAAENVYMNRMPVNKLGLVNYKKMYADCAALLEKLGVSYISPKAKVRNLSVSEQQLLEICKAVSCNAQMLIMDEPTSSLTDTEVKFLLNIVNQLREEGISILYISHKLEEILTIADTITVLRDGQHIATEPAAGMTEQHMVSLMVGREYEGSHKRNFITDYSGKTPILSVRNLYDMAGKVKNVSFDLYPGEVLGLTGLVGAGRSETLQCIFGANMRKSGQIFINGEEVNIKNCDDAIKHGIGDNTGCRIVIRVFIENDRLIMTVSDDGMGILPDKLRQIQQELDAGSPPNPDEISGLALKSVNRRIRLLCGEDSGITIDSEMEEWTCARITLPLRR